MAHDTDDLMTPQEKPNEDVTLGEIDRLLRGFIRTTDDKFREIIDRIENKTVSAESFRLRTQNMDNRMDQITKDLELKRVEHNKDVERLEKMGSQRDEAIFQRLDQLERWKALKEEASAVHMERNKEEREREQKKRDFRLALLSMAAVLVSGALGSVIALLVQ